MSPVGAAALLVQAQVLSATQPTVSQPRAYLSHWVVRWLAPMAVGTEAAT